MATSGVSEARLRWPHAACRHCQRVPVAVAAGVARCLQQGPSANLRRALPLCMHVNIEGRCIYLSLSKCHRSEMYQELGDIGDVAQACKRTQASQGSVPPRQPGPTCTCAATFTPYKQCGSSCFIVESPAHVRTCFAGSLNPQAMLHQPAPLTVLGVFAALRQLAAEKGQGALATTVGSCLPLTGHAERCMSCHRGQLTRHHHCAALPCRRRRPAAARGAVAADCRQGERAALHHSLSGAGRLGAMGGADCLHGRCSASSHLTCRAMLRKAACPVPCPTALLQALRVGANWRSVIPALAKAMVLHKEGAQAPKVSMGRHALACRPAVRSQPRPAVCPSCATRESPGPPRLTGSQLHLRLHRPSSRTQARLDAAAAAATAAFHVCPNLALLIDVMLAHPPEEWEERCPLHPGEPALLRRAVVAFRGSLKGQRRPHKTQPVRQALLPRLPQLAHCSCMLLTCSSPLRPAPPPAPGVPIKPMLAKICSGGLADAARQLKGAPFLGAAGRAAGRRGGRSPGGAQRPWKILAATDSCMQTLGHAWRTRVFAPALIIARLPCHPLLSAQRSSSTMGRWALPAEIAESSWQLKTCFN